MRMRIFSLLFIALLLATPVQAAVVVNVDKSTQRATVAVDGATLNVWPVSTGRPGYDTPNGTFKVNRMDADHLSQEWDNAPMPHTMFFDMQVSCSRLSR
jgi:lipoprotein-anchoring transpeptidase ErfK/SrfK